MRELKIGDIGYLPPSYERCRPHNGCFNEQAHMCVIVHIYLDGSRVYNTDVWNCTVGQHWTDINPEDMVFDKELENRG